MDSEHAVLEVDVFVTQCQDFGDSHSGTGNQTKQRFIHDAPQSLRRPKTPGGSQQIDDLLLAIDMRRQSFRQRSEDGVVRHLSVRFKLL